MIADEFFNLTPTLSVVNDPNNGRRLMCRLNMSDQLNNWIYSNDGTLFAYLLAWSSNAHIIFNRRCPITKNHNRFYLSKHLYTSGNYINGYSYDTQSSVFKNVTMPIGIRQYPGADNVNRNNDGIYFDEVSFPMFPNTDSDITGAIQSALGYLKKKKMNGSLRMGRYNKSFTTINDRYFKFYIICAPSKDFSFCNMPELSTNGENRYTQRTIPIFIYDSAINNNTFTLTKTNATDYYRGKNASTTTKTIEVIKVT